MRIVSPVFTDNILPGRRFSGRLKTLPRERGNPMPPMIQVENSGRLAGSRALSRSSARLVAALFLAIFGIGLVYATGFAGSHVLHNAAHDARHANGFPCH